MNDTKFIEVKIENVRLTQLGFIVFLRRGSDKNVLPICIGPAEAQSIQAAFQRQKFPRPLTHDLFKNVLSDVGCTITRVNITDLKDGTFYARIVLQDSRMGNELEIDSRPSDAMALAVRYNAPIFVHQDVLVQASVDLDQDEVRNADNSSAEIEEETLDPIVKLKNELAEAVVSEKYEEAAKIRDELQRLQDGN